MLCILIIFFYFENKVLVEQTYEDNNGKLKLNKYGNNQVISYSYDEFDRPSIINKMDKKYQRAYVAIYTAKYKRNWQNGIGMHAGHLATRYYLIRVPDSSFIKQEK